MNNWIKSESSMTWTYRGIVTIVMENYDRYRCTSYNDLIGISRTLRDAKKLCEKYLTQIGEL